jgi:LPS export ABC transporter permease LptG/LPS export ABC transporter permease LptF
VPLRPRILTTYILREILGYALLGGLLFTFVLLIRYLLPLLELFVRGIATPLDLLRLFSYLLPNFLTLTLPMAVLIGILLGLSRLAADSEITAMRASGIGVTGFLRIVSILAFAAWGFGLYNALVIAPRATQALLRYEEQAKTSQASIEVQPRVFYEDLKNYVLYVQDVMPGSNGTALWKHVFLADLATPANPHIITANDAVVLGGGGQTLHLELENGARHDIAPGHANGDATHDPAQYDLSTFSSTDLPVQTGQQEDTQHLTRRDTPLQATETPELLRRTHDPHPATALPYKIEFQRRLATPTACLVLMLVGVPLGLSSKRGGKGAAFVLTLLLVFLYYFASTMGIALARDGRLPPVVGVWAANVLFTAAGLALIQQISTGGAALSAIASLGTVIRKPKAFSSNGNGNGHAEAFAFSTGPMQRLRRALHARFPLILDEYVMSSFVRNFALVLLSITVLFLIFTFFELIGDIVKYRTPLVTVGDYLLNLIPFVLYNMTPLCSLVAVLITFGALSRTSELTAMKATGVSLYRVVTPILVIAAILAASLFAFDELYLPQANRRQEALLSTIKGKPAQTFLRPDRKWISGQTNSAGDPTRIFYYQFFDPDKDVFANLTVFEFQPGTFALTRRIFASAAHWDDQTHRWVFDDGWQRTFQGETISGYNSFSVASFPEIHEQPSYFKKEERPSQEMSYDELTRYIHDLQQSGFDTTRLRVQLNRKLAYPLITFVMAIVAVPFALSTGKRGNIAGLGTAIGVAIAYYIISNIFENLGDVSSLPAMLAAWSPDLLFAMLGSYLLLRTPT